MTPIKTGILIAFAILLTALAPIVSLAQGADKASPDIVNELIQKK